MKTTKKTRPYNLITPSEIAEFKALKALHGNGTQAVAVQHTELIAPQDRAFKLAKKSKEVSSVDFIDDKLQQIGVDAVNRVGIMVNSSDEKVATKNSHYVIDHLRGQAVKRSETRNINLSVETLL